MASLEVGHLLIERAFAHIAAYGKESTVLEGTNSIYTASNMSGYI
jgi:hypothetical protein